ncbi:MAG TPA: V-type ATP synthase subunit E family protein [Candidatus Limnocylindrales bacterium]|nr:V-type ATP synthase subunit E family protein [Candidatus Limnocylindrales bacterium]
MSVKDGLSAIANEVLGEVQKEAEKIILSSQNQAKQILKTAKQQADEKYKAFINQATLKAEGEQRKIASVTEVEMRNQLLQSKEKLVDTVFDQALVRIKDFVTTEEYHRYLLRLIKEAAKRLGQKKIVLEVNAKDKAWLTQDALDRLSKKLNCELTLLDQTGDYIGGFKIQTADGKVTYDSTLDNRLTELKPVLRVEVAKILFGKEA